MQKIVVYALIGALFIALAPIFVRGETDVDTYIVNGGYFLKDGSPSIQYNADSSFIPASTIKILTSLIALETLGPDCRFETHIFLDKQNNLNIKGFGDPFLTSETVLKIGKELRAHGIREVRQILLDNSVFSIHENESWYGASSNPYDAPNGSLAVNFNALPVAVTSEGAISSGEEQTPVLPIMTQAGKNLEEGFNRINVNILDSSISLSPTLQYSGELFAAQLSKAGIIIHKGFKREEVPDDLQPIYIHKSDKPLKQIIQACLKYSNNFIANQIFLSYGAAEFGQPATWAKSQKLTARYLHNLLGDRSIQIKIIEGSGISRENRISPAALLTILEHFKPYAALLQQRGKLFLKSGTLSDVFCYAGYHVKNRALLPLVIMLNQKENRRDEILEQLLMRVNASEIRELQ